MSDILILILQSLIGSIVCYGLVRIASLLCERPGELSKSPIVSLLFGFFIVTSVVALIVTKGKTTSLFPLLLILYFKRKDIFSYRVVNWKKVTISLEFFLILFNILIHWLVFYDWKNDCFFSEWTDSYHYANNVTGIMATHMECVMHECSNARIGYDAESTFYHFSEYFLTIVSKWILGRSSYFNLFFIVIPVIMSLTQVQAINFLKNNSKISKINALAMVLGLTTCIRFFNIGAILPGELNGFSHFPLFQISDYFNTYFYNFNGKISLFLLLFFSLFTLWKDKNMLDFGLCLIIAPVINLIYFPFFILYFSMLSIAENRPFKKILSAFILVPIALIHLIYLNYGKNLMIHPVPPQLDFFLNWDWRNSLKLLKSAWIYFLGNFYPHFLFISLLLVLNKKKPILWAFFLLIISFPFLLNIKIAATIVFLFSAFLGLYFVRWTSKRSMPIFMVLWSLVVLQALFGLNHLEIRDIFQFKELPLISLVLVLPILLITEFQISISHFSWIIGLIFTLHNIFEQHFLQNRVYFRSQNSTDFLKSYQKKTGGRMIRAAYLTFNQSNPVNADLENRCGFDIMNITDSLDFFYLGPDHLSRSDTIRMARGLLSWKIHERQPFNIFSKKNSHILQIDSIRIAFMKTNHIQAYFRKSEGPRIKMQYLNPYLFDSLYNPSDKYWVYFLNFEKPKIKIRKFQ